MPRQNQLPKMLKMEIIKDIKNPNNQELLLDYQGYRSLAEAKAKTKLKTDVGVFKRLQKIHNDEAEEFNKRAKHIYERELAKYNEKQKIKRNKVISNALKKKITDMREKMKPTFSVVIEAKISTFLKKANKTTIKTEDYQENFTCYEYQIEQKVVEFLSQYYPFDDEYRLITLLSFKYQVHKPKPKVHIMDVPMKRATPVKLSFLKYVEDINNISYENHDDQCVIQILKYHLHIKKDKTITEVFQRASKELYKKEWKKEDGVSSRMLLYFCKELNIPLLGLDQKSKSFVKFVRDEHGNKKYRSILFYMCVGHFYLINDEKAVRHISQSFKDNTITTTTLIKEEEKEKSHNYIHWADIFQDESRMCPGRPTFEPTASVVKALPFDSIFSKDGKEEEFEVLHKLPSNTIVLMPFDLTDYLKEYIRIFNIYPKPKFQSLACIQQITLKNHVILQSTDYLLSPDEVKEICTKTNIPYKNQTIGVLLTALLEKFYSSSRVSFTKQERENIKQIQCGLCALCKEELNEKFEIDHIRPLSNGGTNEKENLQALCKSCHQDKTKTEHNNCDHFKVRDYVSNYNIEAYNAIKSKFFSKVQFSEFLLSENEIEKLQSKYKMYSIDDNKCRRNLLINYHFEFPVYSCLDNIEKFDGKLTTGFYYLENVSKTLPFRGNGFYSFPFIVYCLKNRLMNFKNIKYQYKPSFKLPKDYFKPFVQFILNITEDKDSQKLLINSLVGLFGRRYSCYIDSILCDKKNDKDYDFAYTSFKQPYMNDINEDYAVATQKISIDKLEGTFPIHAQVLDCEAIELHKKIQLLEQNGAIPICVKTDAVVYFAKEPINIENYYWDKEKTILKYKHEYPELLKKSLKYEISDRFQMEDLEYDVIEDDETPDFNVKIVKQISKEGSYFIDGKAGTGKTKLLNELKKSLEGKNVLRLTPTNVSALLIGGETIDKFTYAFVNGGKAFQKFNKFDYIFIDEVSMMREKFYAIFLSIKYSCPSVRFIISGDFHQLEPVNDRRLFDYENSKALFELVDGNKILLTKCRRSDDKLFNLCESILNDEPYSIEDLCDKDFVSYKNICYTNAKRKEVNSKCMERFLKGVEKTYPVKSLSYDKNTQDYILCEGMPLISRLNLKEMKICNNEMFMCKEIKDDVIVVTNEFKTLEIRKEKFNKIFQMGFCITTHKSQGLSLDEKYCIYEFQRFTKKLKYVALSRATKYENINIL
jgi:5-methylcytosine-specific restriction endonuclease McrA